METKEISEEDMDVNNSRVRFAGSVYRSAAAAIVAVLFGALSTDAFGFEAETRHPASRIVRANRANLAGVDHLGRVLPGAAETGPVKNSE